MSLFDRVRSAVTFRTATPGFEPGEEFTAYVTGTNESGVVVRIGDSKLLIPDADHALLDEQVRLRVRSFDAASHEGEAELLSVVGAD
jgi:DNA-directed RNA polymerase subunit E'/Rpb7